MKNVLSLLTLILISVSALYSQIKVGDEAPTFSMYQYKDMTFDTDTVYGNKIVTFIFGSIT